MCLNKPQTTPKGKRRRMIGWRNSLERTSDVAVRRDTVNGLGCANVPAESAHSALWPPRFFPSTGLLELQSALCIDIWPRSTADEKNINLQSHGSSRRHFVRSSTEFCDARCDTRVESHKASVTRLLLSRSVVVAINVCLRLRCLPS